MRRFALFGLRAAPISATIGFGGAFRDVSGKVRAWKHFSGYGFVTGADGVEYYTNRQELAGGFFLVEGQDVEFEAAKDDPTKSPRAVKVRNADGTAITPVEIQGVVSECNASGGMIAELDIRGQRHPDAPLFPFTRDQVDFKGELRPNDQVRFALDPQTQLPIMIVGRLRKRDGYSGFASRNSPGDSGAGAGAAAGTPDTGTIRDLRDSFGFITCNSSNESIFFHKNDIVGTPLSVGDLVRFTKGFDSSKKNQGKPRGTNVTKVEG